MPCVPDRFPGTGPGGGPTRGAVVEDRGGPSERFQLFGSTRLAGSARPARRARRRRLPSVRDCAAAGGVLTRVANRSEFGTLAAQTQHCRRADTDAQQEGRVCHWRVGQFYARVWRLRYGVAGAE